MRTEVVSLATGIDVPLQVPSRIPTGFRSGFTMRAGGVSLPPFDSLNLGWKWGDDRGHVDENHRRLLALSGGAAMFRVSQVHGVRILRVRRGDDLVTVAAQEADGLCSDAPGLVLSIHVADCTPILIGCAQPAACAALHAGWRSTVAGMAKAGVQRMLSEFGCQARDLHVALGPCIGPCCFEVGKEVEAAFVSAMPKARENGVILERPGKKAHIDLRLFQRLQFETAGVLPQNIEAGADCTLCDPNRRFFSFRRSGRATGQMVGFIARID
jgi:YfiH family protein